MAFSIKSFFASAPHKVGAKRLYVAIVDHARDGVFYRDLGVPDTVTGRYAMIALHVFAVMERLSHAEGGDDVSQALVDAMVEDLDRNLREMGVGDLSVGKRVRKLVGHFYAMAAACRDGLNRGDATLCGALNDYVYGAGGPSPAALQAMASYLRACMADLEDQIVADLSAGRVRFAEASQGARR